MSFTCSEQTGLVGNKKKTKMNKSILGQKEDETKPENSVVNRCMTGKNIKQGYRFIK